ncbi:hypothetical protein P4O66_002628 [Electrophorus voltai]|uniref:Uncharacterized protein n=1 Tax=Electrophorus voltai TaxID=2609070 RepID=A0AAD9DN46_9TELE|nr:hypothetical protein P4O66_002628 [Electrophorus voltai]
MAGFWAECSRWAMKFTPSANLVFSSQARRPERCVRNPCMHGEKACVQAPVSVNLHFMSIVSNMTTPRVLFRLSAVPVLVNTLRFGLLGRRDSPLHRAALGKAERATDAVGARPRPRPAGG